jgi:NAD(P)-dependent dehydrogenase (short-subunit alcohol dehydrogenase family)
MQVKNSVVLVTGGASGLGAAVVRRLAEGGARVVVADLDQTKGAALAAAIGEACAYAEVDVTDSQSVQGAVDLAVSRFGGLHASIQCAGIVGGARVLGKEGPHDLALFQKIIQVNLVGTFNVCRLAAAAMARGSPGPDGERGALVNTASVAAFDGQIGQAAYAASKGGVASMTLPMARDLGRQGIRVVTIAPGVFDTPMMDGLGQALSESLSALTPFPNRLGRPEEFALLVQHVLENPMLNGEVIRLDGGLRMPAKG